MTSLTPFSLFGKCLPLKTTRGFILRPLAIAERHTVMCCFSCPVVNSGKEFVRFTVIVVAPGISYQIAVSSMLPMQDGAMLFNVVTFLHGLTKLTTFCVSSAGNLCPTVVFFLNEKTQIANGCYRR